MKEELKKISYVDSKGIKRRTPIMEADQLFMDSREIFGFEQRKGRVLMRCSEIEYWASVEMKPHWRLVHNIIYNSSEGDFPINVLNYDLVHEKFKKFNKEVL
jgi:hypothetical protein